MTHRPAEGASPLSHDANEGASVTEMVRQGIAKAREKLLDLSLRNGMLNYRHSETSSRHVRIVDAKPELIVETLASGTAIDILALPPVEAGRTRPMTSKPKGRRLEAGSSFSLRVV